jgi:hypothetical protein
MAFWSQPDFLYSLDAIISNYQLCRGTFCDSRDWKSYSAKNHGERSTVKKWKNKWENVKYFPTIGALVYYPKAFKKQKLCTVVVKWIHPFSNKKWLSFALKYRLRHHFTQNMHWNILFGLWTKFNILLQIIVQSRLSNLLLVKNYILSFFQSFFLLLMEQGKWTMTASLGKPLFCVMLYQTYTYKLITHMDL